MVVASNGSELYIGVQAPCLVMMCNLRPFGLKVAAPEGQFAFSDMKNSCGFINIAISMTPASRFTRARLPTVPALKNTRREPDSKSKTQTLKSAIESGRYNVAAGS